MVVAINNLDKQNMSLTGDSGHVRNRGLQVKTLILGSLARNGLSLMISLVIGFLVLPLADIFTAVMARDVQGIRLQVSSFTLENQMQVVVIEDHRSPVITHMVWYQVGSADEPPGKSGIAHFLEHLMFKGTETRAPGEFSKQVALNGGTENAFTSYDYTAYHQRIAKDRLPILMKLEADRMANLRLLENDVKVEREVILEERGRRYGNSPGARLSEQMDAALYLNHPYMRPVIGWKHEIMQLTLDDAIAFYERYYSPSNAILVVAGDITPDEVRLLSKDTYGAVVNRAVPILRERVSEPPHIAERRVMLKHAQVSVNSWRRTYLVPSYSTAPKEFRSAFTVFSQVLGYGSLSRLYRDLVIDKKVAVDVGAYYSGSALDYGEFSVYATPSPGVSMEAIERNVDKVLDRVFAEGFTDEELERAKIKLIADTVFDQDSQSRMSRAFGAALATGLTVDDVISWPTDVQAVSADAAVSAARTYLHKESSVVGLLISDHEPPEIFE